jgi:Zn-dependent metalloprotease
LRSMAAPGTAYDDDVLGKDPQPAHMDDFVVTSEDDGGVHINSGIPNHAFYVVATTLGGNAWDRAGRVWYETARDRGLRSTATFADFARITVAVSGQLFGAGGAVEAAVRGGWDAVGVAWT